MPRYELNLWDYGQVIRRRKWIILLVFLVVWGSTGLYLHLQKPVYQATVTVRYTRQLQIYFERVTGYYSRPLGEPMETQSRVARSSLVLKKAAETVGLIQSEMSDEDKNQVVVRLQDTVSTEAVERTDLIKIKVLHSDPAMTAKIANAVAQAYIEENLREKSREARKTEEFLKERLTEIEKKLTETEETLSGFKKSFLVATLREKQQLSAETQQILNQRLSEINRELSVTESALQRFKKTVYVDNTFRTQYLKLSQHLEALETERAGLLRQYTEKHPDVAHLTEEINNLKAELTPYETKIKEQSDLETEQTRLNREVKITEDLYTDYKQRLEQVGHKPALSLDDITLTEEIKKYPELEKEFNRLSRDLEINASLYQDLKQKYTAAEVEAAQVPDVVLVDEATVPNQPIKPNIPQTVLIGIIIGLIMGLAVAFLIEHLDTSVRTIEEVEDFTKLPVLATIPHINSEKNQLVLPHLYPFLVSQITPQSAPAEAYRTLRTALQFVSDQTQQVILFTSAGEKEGKSITSINCAITLAQVGHRTLLIDGDLRRSLVHRVFGLGREPGLAEILEGKLDYRRCLRGLTDFLLNFTKATEIIKTPGLENLYLLTAGHRTHQPAELLNAPYFTDFITAVKRDFRFVLFDTSPVLPVTDALIIASKVDAIVMVHQIGKIARGILYRAKNQLEGIKTKILGIVLNNLKPSEMEAGLPYYYYGQKYYHYAEHS